MDDTIGSKHTTEEQEEKKDIKHAQGQLKKDSADALDEHQWHKHPGGG